MYTISIPVGSHDCAVRVYDGSTMSAPVVVVFMDAFGPRPALLAIAERLSAEGYRVLVPDLFYCEQPFLPFDAPAVFAGGGERDRLMGMFAGITQSRVDRDVTAILDWVAANYGNETKLGCVGYCMGGRYALTAAVTSPRVVAAASFHGANLAVDAPESPHHRFAGIAARMYVGIAGIDEGFRGDEEGRLAAAMRTAGVDHMIETYRGAHHGFALQDLPVHHPRAAERHWQRLAETLAEAFAA